MPHGPASATLPRPTPWLTRLPIAAAGACRKGEANCESTSEDLWVGIVGGAHRARTAPWRRQGAIGTAGGPVVGQDRAVGRKEPVARSTALLFSFAGPAAEGRNRCLLQCGGNSFRTWGIGPATRKELDEAQRFGLRLTLGVWLGHKEHGFNYNDAGSVQKQKEQVRQAVLRYKDHPALLMWGLGNEMENPRQQHPATLEEYRRSCEDGPRNRPQASGDDCHRGDWR